LRWAAVGDERLARLVAEANEWAFAALYERYHQPLYRYCRSIVRTDVDAQDALQSAFASAYTALKRGQRDAPLRPWLFRIAHNEAVSLLRRRRPEDELSEALESSMASVEEQAGERARLALLLADLHELPERQRGALVMRELSGLSHEEIATALGTSVGAAKQTIFEARRSLLEFAEGREMACDEVSRAISDGDGRVLRARRVRAHIRECSACAAFAAAIPARSSDLRALTPVLPAVSAAGVLGRVVGSGSGHGGAGGLAASATGKTVSLALAAKAVAGVAILATATVGVATAIKPTAHTAGHPAATHTAAPGRAGGAGHGRHLGSPALTGGSGARSAGSNGAGRRAGRSGRAGTTAPSAARGAGAPGSGVSGSGAAHAPGKASATAQGAGSRGAAGRRPGRAGSHGTQHPHGPAVSVHGTRRTTTATSRRPSTPTSRRPSTPTSRRPSTPTSARPSTPTSARPSTPTSARPSTPTSARPSTPTSVRPGTPTSGAPSVPTVTTPSPRGRA
jgi:RNA polymerase sigma factor (sigma-70 family)